MARSAPPAGGQDEARRPDLFVGAIHHTIAPSVYKNLDYDLEKNFEPITMIALVPQVISINPNKIPAKTAQEFIAYVKANLNKVNYASAGAGTAHHLAGELFKLETKTEIVHVPYRGAGPGDAGPARRQRRHDVRRHGHKLPSRSRRASCAALRWRRRARAGILDMPTAAEIGVPA